MRQLEELEERELRRALSQSRRDMRVMRRAEVETVREVARLEAAKRRAAERKDNKDEEEDDTEDDSEDDGADDETVVVGGSESDTEVDDEASLARGPKSLMTGVAPVSGRP
jgi:hypothetical protein